MSEQINQELATLRQTVAELTQKNATRKARITDLEAQLAASQGAAQTAQASLHTMLVTQPMQTLAAAISPTPELFLSELSRIGYKVTSNDGKLTLTDADDKPVEGAEMTTDGLRKHLLSADAKHKNFVHLMTLSRASGGGALGQSQSNGLPPADRSDKPVRTQRPQFGLR
ncbi:hypothetical protein Terro_1142 [Terriglobus roseus DSM 18391]|uniref:Uncharacterized protein n=1 Tax=Terriglobus roseus (strain DSM 18391 / NRRL B-41598 / KBS 63) TaxID=926566 RepID=I3ZDZ2_TERRK|nr:hypothetical protein [Terriglobus roseus]AFL87460.1 hypothetical protein Terro_1142 [Terriglobus roseus DSM 18391]